MISCQSHNCFFWPLKELERWQLSRWSVFGLGLFCIGYKVFCCFLGFFLHTNHVHWILMLPIAKSNVTNANKDIKCDVCYCHLRIAFSLLQASLTKSWTPRKKCGSRFSQTCAQTASASQPTRGRRSKWPERECAGPRPWATAESNKKKMSCSPPLINWSEKALEGLQ